MFGIISHVSVGTNDIAASARFYDAVMPAIGSKRIMTIYQRTDPAEGEDAMFKEMGTATSPTTCDADKCQAVAVAYGKYAPEFWIQMTLDRNPATPGNGTHFAFSGKNQAMVRAWYDAAIAAGAKDNGPPGPRPQYGKQYYGAFAIDPDGNKIECMYWDMGWMGYCAIQ